MTVRKAGQRARTFQVALAAGAMLAAGLGSSASFAADPDEDRAPAHSEGGADARGNEARGFYDVRHLQSSSARASELKSAARAMGRKDTRALASSIPGRAVLDIDGTTGTVRMLSRLDGYLTGPSSKAPKQVVAAYLRKNTAALGLVPGDLLTFELNRDYKDITGTHHLYYIQKIGGRKVRGNGLIAAVSKSGRLMTLGGSPVSKAVLPAPAPMVIGSAAEAIAAARVDLGEDPAATTSRDSAEEVLFVTPRGTYVGWSTIIMSASHPATSVLDAHSGRLLMRRPLSSDAVAESLAPPSTGLAFEYHPGAQPGGKAKPINYTKRGWLPAGATKLDGNNSHAYSDVDDDNQPAASEEVKPSSGHAWNYKLKPFKVKNVSFCGNPWPCSWDPNKRYSWKVNRAQNTAQVFYFVNNFHDHLLAKPIGFTEAAGNFENLNSTKQGKGRDAVDTQTLDGANTDNGLPDGDHIDNANMSTPPDGHAPTMQLYLQHAPGSKYPSEDPWPPNNVGDEADTVYHEYTHGLSNRLVVDSWGHSTLGPVQAGSMGEAWGDWYAMDYLVSKKLQKDKADKVDLVMFRYDGAGAAFDRTEPLDCTIGSPEAKCPGGETGHTGGYTYADFGKVTNGPEVHADGEIWAQAMWTLRGKLGSKVSQSLMTRAMELAPANPSFVDMRNAMLVADTAVYQGKNHAKIWKAYASRGMGFYAGSIGGDDAKPAADFKVPPAKITDGFLTGTVTDAATGVPVAGVPVTLAFQGQGLANPTTVTAADGTYHLGPVPAGHYAKLMVNGSGYDPVSAAVDVSDVTTPTNFSVRRDWAATSGGASVVEFNGPDYTAFGCGPEQALDTSQATGWGSTTGDNKGLPTNVFKPKHLTVDLGRAINVTDFGIDPTATCGDGASASTAKYTIETSPDNVTWTVASSGEFTVDHQGKINQVVPTTGTAGVRYVRFTILSNQTPDFANNCPDGGYSGCTYSDLTELEVYGVAVP